MEKTIEKKIPCYNCIFNKKEYCIIFYVEDVYNQYDILQECSHFKEKE